MHFISHDYAELAGNIETSVHTTCVCVDCAHHARHVNYGHKVRVCSEHHVEIPSTSLSWRLHFLTGHPVLF